MEVGDVIGAGELRHELAHPAAHERGVRNAGGISEHDRLRAFREVEIDDLLRIELSAGILFQACRHGEEFRSVVCQ